MPCSKRECNVGNPGKPVYLCEAERGPCINVIQWLKSVDGPHDSCSSHEKDCIAFTYSLALTRMSFRDFPLRYDRMGGSLKIFLSSGWFCIKCHFPMSISFKLGKAGWYCVTKGRIFFCAVLFLFVRDVSLSENLTSERCFSTVAAG